MGTSSACFDTVINLGSWVFIFCLFLVVNLTPSWFYLPTDSWVNDYKSVVSKSLLFPCLSLLYHSCLDISIQLSHFKQGMVKTEQTILIYLSNQMFFWSPSFVLAFLVGWARNLESFLIIFLFCLCLSPSLYLYLLSHLVHLSSSHHHSHHKTIQHWAN